MFFKVIGIYILGSKDIHCMKLIELFSAVDVCFIDCKDFL